MNEDSPTLTGPFSVPARRDMPSNIGCYQIVEVLGQGGMGTVYLAQQTEPVQRRVALKVVKWGMDRDVVLARFELERQALARMNHPSIAAVLDAGSTDQGYPYFVMEYVHGESITSYCNGHHLGVDERLHLFNQVCDAVAHAHRRMVIHRDLKPSNIMVTEIDNKPIPKVIDFGVARFTESSNELGLTSIGAPVGTPAYLAPEQIEGAPGTLDARVDVYSLGVVLYELLCGAKPYAESGTVHQLMMRILTEDPPTPSTRLAHLELEAKKAIQASMEERFLQRKLKGELDWIVMKAIARNRDERYDDVAQLQQDLERYYQNRPLLAKPPTMAYRLHKFLKRHRFGVVSGLAILVILITGLITTTAAMIRADKARRKAEEAEKTAQVTVDYLRQILASADPSQDGRDVRVVDLLDRASKMITSDMDGRPEIEAPLRKTLGWTYLELGLYDRAKIELQATIDLQTRVLGEDHLETLDTTNALGRLAYKLGHYDEAATVHRKVLERETALQGAEHPTTLWTMYNLAKALDRQGKLEEAEQLYRLNVTLRTKVLGPNHPHTLVSTNSLGLMLAKRNKLDEAEHLLRSNIEVLRRSLGREHPNTLNAMSNLVAVLNRYDRWDEALALAEELRPLQEKVFGQKHPETLETCAQQSFSLTRLNRCDQALPIAEMVLEERHNNLGPNHPQTHTSQLELAETLTCLGRYRQALPLYEQVLGAGQPKPTPADLYHPYEKGYQLCRTKLLLN